MNRSQLRESNEWWKRRISDTNSGMIAAPPCGGSRPAPKWDGSHSDIEKEGGAVNSHVEKEGEGTAW